MASGMEMMINALIKATGINPDEVVKQFSDAQKLLVESTQNFDQRLIALEKAQQENTLVLKKFIKSFEEKEF